MNRITLLCALTLGLFFIVPAAAEDRFFDSEGVRIHYTEQGPPDGDPVILIHGGLTNIEAQWTTPGIVDALDDVYRVIALDLRGHGQSDKPHDPHMYGNAMGVDVIRLMDHLNIEKAHVVGYSMGGRITYKLVADYPDRVISAMPCGAGWGPPSQTRDDLFERLAVSLEKSGSIRPVLDHFVSDGSMTVEEIEQIDARIRESNDTKALAAMARSIPELRPDRAKLEANTVPCMCVIGERDPNRADVDAMLEYMPNLDISVVDGADHMTAFRDPAFIAAITSFIGRHATAGRWDRSVSFEQ